jgi:thiol-disulfide isomerase/thioredoxin
MINNENKYFILTTKLYNTFSSIKLKVIFLLLNFVLPIVVFALDKGDKAPEFILVSATGENISLDSFRGNYIYLDFWASWCVPCRESLPWITSLTKEITNIPLKVITINLDEDWDSAQKLLSELKIQSLNVLRDSNGTTPEKYKVKTMPTSFVIDPAGKIIARIDGFTDKEKVVVTDLLKSLHKE